MIKDLFEKQKNDDSKKIFYFEVLRVVAIFFVIFNHTEQNGFFLFSQFNSSSTHFWFYLFMSIFCKFAVFIFFAISGALLLGRETKSFKELWRKKILRMVIVLIVISLVYYFIDLMKYQQNFNLGYFVEKIYSSTLKYHLWYLYAYIAFLISLPLLQSLIKNMKKKHFIYMIVLAIFFGGILPVLEYIFSKGTVTMNANLKVSWLISTIVLYPCIGYYLNKYVVVTKKKLIGAWVLNIAGIAVSMIMTFVKGQDAGGQFPIATSQSFHSTFALINCIAVFMTVKYVCGQQRKIKEKKFSIRKGLRWLILSLGECTFGIYLVHLIFLKTEMCKNMFSGMAAAGINKMITAFIVCVWVLLLSYVVVFVLKKLPIVRRLL